MFFQGMIWIDSSAKDAKVISLVRIMIFVF